jgi:translation initiation factor IF-1
MAKEELIQFEGLVTEILPDARYRVQLDAGHEIVAYTAGKMKKILVRSEHLMRKPVLTWRARC